MTPTKLLIISMIVLAILITVDVLLPDRVDRRVEFMSQFTTREGAIYELKWVEVFGLDWQKSFAVTLAESDGKQMAKSIFRRNGKIHHAYGQKQVVGLTLAYWRKRAEFFGIKDTNKYSLEFNIFSGCGELAKWVDYYEGDYIKAVHVYNVGFGDITYKRKINPKHIDKWLTEYTVIKNRWEKFKRGE